MINPHLSDQFSLGSVFLGIFGTSMHRPVFSVWVLATIFILSPVLCLSCCVSGKKLRPGFSKTTFVSVHHHFYYLLNEITYKGRYQKHTEGGFSFFRGEQTIVKTGLAAGEKFLTWIKLPGQMLNEQC